MDVSGIFPALTTPYHQDGSVALDHFKADLARYNKTGLAGYVVLGSTGESVLLSSSEADSLLAAGFSSPAPVPNPQPKQLHAPNAPPLSVTTPLL
jgi:dihydrodipicolinate synthase/N-acetylneuraminate lyase